MSDTKELLYVLGERPIAFYPVYRHITGGITSGILLSQLVYWWVRREGDTIYKTNEEFMAETALSEWELKTAKRKLVSLGLISTTVQGLPATTHYTLNTDTLHKLISKCAQGETTSSDEEEQSESTEPTTETTNDTNTTPPNKLGGILPTGWVESSQLSISEITTEIFREPSVRRDISSSQEGEVVKPHPLAEEPDWETLVPPSFDDEFQVEVADGVFRTKRELKIEKARQKWMSAQSRHTPHSSKIGQGKTIAPSSEQSTIKKKKTSPRPFNHEAEMQKLKDSETIADKILHFYYQRKGYVFTSWQQWIAERGRSKKFAEELAGYSKSEVERAMLMVEAEAEGKYDWKLSTVAKKIIELFKS